MGAVQSILLSQSVFMPPWHHYLCGRITIIWISPISHLNDADSEWPHITPQTSLPIVHLRSHVAWSATPRVPNRKRMLQLRSQAEISQFHHSVAWYEHVTWFHILHHYSTKQHALDESRYDSEAFPDPEDNSRQSHGFALHSMNGALGNHAVSHKHSTPWQSVSSFS